MIYMLGQKKDGTKEKLERERNKVSNIFITFKMQEFSVQVKEIMSCRYKHP